MFGLLHQVVDPRRLVERLGEKAGAALLDRDAGQGNRTNYREVART
jgi:hypothetical protein